MSSEVPQQSFDATFAAKIEKLIARAVKIADYIDPYDEYARNEDVVLLDLNNWMNEVDAIFNTHELRALLPHYFSLTRKMTPPKLPRGTVIAFGNTEHYQKSMTFRKELRQHISSMIDSLKQIKETYKEHMEPIIIHIDTDGLMWKEDRNKYSLKFKNKDTKRVKLIIMLSKSTRHTKTDKIMEHVPYTTLQTLSKEKNWINRTLQKVLELPGELIESGGKTAHVGYRINPIFVIKLEKK